MADFGDNADRVSKGRDDYVDTRQADVEGDDAEKLTLREKFLMGIEVVVPSDCSLYEALSALPTSGGNILVKEGSTHSWEGCVDLRCHDLVLIGEKTISAAQQRSGEAVIVRCPRVQGQLHFGDGSGTVEALEFSCNEASKGIEQVVSISGGVWTLTDCLVRCSSGSGREGDDNNRNHKGDGCNYRGFDVALHASGGEITLLGCRLGGFASNRLAYHSIYVSSRGKVIASGTTLCNCYGSAVEVKPSSPLACHPPSLYTASVATMLMICQGGLV